MQKCYPSNSFEPRFWLYLASFDIKHPKLWDKKIAASVIFVPTKEEKTLCSGKR